MESPFANFSTTSGTSQCVALYLEPYLNSYLKTYQQIITLSAMPLGPISPMVKRIHFDNLSPFYSAGSFSTGSNGVNCTLALMRYPNGNSLYSSNKSCDAFLGSDDIPAVFGFLQSNGYTINTDLVKMMNGSKIQLGGNFSENGKNGIRRLICMFTYTLSDFYLDV